MKSIIALAVLVALASCSEEPPPTPVGPSPSDPLQGMVDDGKSDDPIPNAGRFPHTVRLEVDGEPIPALRVEEFFRSAWASYLASPAAGKTADEQLAGFFANPGERCAALLIEVEIEAEAERLFDVIDPKEVDALATRLRAGGLLLWFEQVAGAEAARAYVERTHRRELLESLFVEYSEEVPEEDVLAVYDEDVLSQIPDAAEREGVDVSYEKLGPQIRARLQRERGLANLASWAQEAAAKRKLVVVLPDGSKLE